MTVCTYKKSCEYRGHTQVPNCTYYVVFTLMLGSSFVADVGRRALNIGFSVGSTIEMYFFANSYFHGNLSLHFILKFFLLEG